MLAGLLLAALAVATPPAPPVSVPPSRAARVVAILPMTGEMDSISTESLSMRARQARAHEGKRHAEQDRLRQDQPGRQHAVAVPKQQNQEKRQHHDRQRKKEGRRRAVQGDTGHPQLFFLKLDLQQLAARTRQRQQVGGDPS